MKKSKGQEIKTKNLGKEYLELENLKAMLARSLADYDNLTKRTEREREVLTKMSSVGIVTKILPVLDNLESAQEHLQDAGLAISIGEFKKILNEEGLVEINPGIGDEFDENTMEAIEITKGTSDNNSIGDGKISEVVLKGWKFNNEQVVRHAKVKVSKINS